jgi:hypothetical protein
MVVEEICSTILNQQTRRNNMSIDMSKMKQKLANLNSKGGSSNGVQMWKIEDGDHTIRIVPTDDGDPFKELWFHYGVGGQNFLCPKKNFSDDCPVCNFASQLWKEGTANEDKNSQKMAKDLFPRQRFMSPVLVRGDEKKGVQVWSYGKEAYTALIGLVLNPEYGDITDPQDGIDLDINYGKPPGANFPKTKITPRRRSSPLCDPTYGGKDKCKEILDTIPDFSTIHKRASTEEVQKILDAALASDDSAESESHEVVRESTKKSKPATEAVDSAFEEFANT